jgi:hypothetical protein
VLTSIRLQTISLLQELSRDKGSDGLSRAARLNDKRSEAGWFYAGCTNIYIYIDAGANTVGFTVSAAAPSVCPHWNVPRTEADQRRRSKLRIVAPDRLSFGSMSIRTFTISPAPVIRPYEKGAYMCEAEAQNSGNRAAMNERHP